MHELVNRFGGDTFARVSRCGTGPSRPSSQPSKTGSIPFKKFRFPPVASVDNPEQTSHARPDRPFAVLHHVHRARAPSSDGTRCRVVLRREHGLPLRRRRSRTHGSRRPRRRPRASTRRGSCRRSRATPGATISPDSRNTSAATLPAWRIFSMISGGLIRGSSHGTTSPVSAYGGRSIESGTPGIGDTTPGSTRPSDRLWHRLYLRPLPHQQASFASGSTVGGWSTLRMRHPF